MGKEKLVLVGLVMFDLVSQLAAVQIVIHPDISESRCLKLLRIANATSGCACKAACAKKERKRLNDGNNNGASKAAWAKNCGRLDQPWSLEYFF